MAIDFDAEWDHRGLGSLKWEFIVRDGEPQPWDRTDPDLGEDRVLPMWVADMDFRPPQVVQDALQAQIDHGVHGYFGDDSKYLAAIQWWMENRHGWKVDAEAILTTHGLVNGTAMCVDAFTQPGDGVVLFTPVYHAFARVINAAERRVVEVL